MAEPGTASSPSPTCTKELLAEFERHQFALLHRGTSRPPSARLAAFTGAPRAPTSAAVEEELFDTVFRPRHRRDAQRPDPWAARRSTSSPASHKHFRAMLREFERDAARLDAADPEVDARVLQLLDTQTTFKEFSPPPRRSARGNLLYSRPRPRRAASRRRSATRC
jgi:hypothetical protein